MKEMPASLPAIGPWDASAPRAPAGFDRGAGFSFDYPAIG